MPFFYNIMENIKETEKGIYDLLQNKPIEFEINLSNPTFWQKLFKKTTRKYEIKPLVLYKYFQITSILDSCNELISPKENGNILANSIAGIIKYKDEIITIVSLFISESKDFVLKNIDIKELQMFFIKILELNNHVEFFFIMESAKSQITMRIPAKEKAN